jgi:hypothetical protein
LLLFFNGRSGYRLRSWLIGEPGWEKLAERALAWLKEQKL